MLEDLQRQFDGLEDARRELVRKVRRLDPKHLKHKPGPERWSILQDLQHLVLAEERMPLEFGAIPASEEPQPDHLAMVLDVLDGDMLVDVPDPGMVPDGDAELEDLVRGWEQARERLGRFLETVDVGDRDTPVSRHPVTGPLPASACLRLLASHFHHHRRRIEAAIQGGVPE